jgi:hypothetical protein
VVSISSNKDKRQVDFNCPSGPHVVKYLGHTAHLWLTTTLVDQDVLETSAAENFKVRTNEYVNTLDVLGLLKLHDVLGQ